MLSAAVYAVLDIIHQELVAMPVLITVNNVLTVQLVKLALLHI
jgi:hypothetical protein